MSLVPGTVGVSIAALAWIKSCVAETSVSTFAVKNQLPPHSVRKMLRGEGVRPSTAFRVEALVPKADREQNELEVLETVLAEVKAMRALITDFIASQAPKEAA